MSQLINTADDCDSRANVNVARKTLPNAHLVRANGFLVSRWKHQKFASTDVYVAKGGNFCLDLRSQPRDRHCCLTAINWLLVDMIYIIIVNTTNGYCFCTFSAEFPYKTNCEHTK